MIYTNANASWVVDLAPLLPADGFRHDIAVVVFVLITGTEWVGVCSIFALDSCQLLQYNGVVIYEYRKIMRR